MDVAVAVAKVAGGLVKGLDVVAVAVKMVEVVPSEQVAAEVWAVAGGLRWISITSIVMSWRDSS